MRVNLLWVSLLLALSACQPDTPAKKDVSAVESAPQVAVAVATLPENDPLALAKKSHCLSCHDIDKKRVGPAWKEVAVRYRGDSGAETRLMNKVAQGGGGVWGAVPMPAHPQLSEADRRTLVKFVLNLQ